MTSILHIPCKTESIRCPEKNLAIIMGRPSLVWCIETAIRTGLFDSIIVSTDHPEKVNLEGYTLIDYSHQVGVSVKITVVPQNPSTVIQTTHDILFEHDHQGRVSIMLPTACLVSQDDIAGAVKLSEEKDSPVMMVVRVPYRSDEIVYASPDGLRKRYQERHQGEFHGIGDLIDAGAFYTFPPRQFKGVTQMYVPTLRPYQIPRWRGMDVDEPEDLELVRRLFLSGSNV